MSNQNEQQSRLQAILDSAVDGIITIDLQGTVESMNPAAELLFGYAASEVVGNNVKLLMPSPFHEEHDGYLENYIRTGVRKIIGIGREVVGRRKDASTFPMYLAVSEFRLGDQVRFTGIVRDLSDLKDAEETGSQLGRILEDSLNEVFVFDFSTMKFVFLNRGARENIGYSMEEMSSMTPLDIKPQMTAEDFEEIIDQLRKSPDSSVRFETVHQRNNGSRYHADISLQTAIWHGTPVYVAIILDVTEQKQIRDQLESLNSELEQRVEERTQELKAAQEQLLRREKLTVLGQLSGGVAHEIRNPLGVIKNSVYYLKMIGDKLDEDARECIEEIDREVVTANRIISELLDFTREPKPQIETFVLSDAIENSVRMAAVKDAVDLTLPIDEAQVKLRADQGQIERILTNLLRNARQAMTERGSITVSVRQDGELVHIEVADTGPGISAENLASIFEPLFTTKAKGIGLGLAVSRRYAERNGGTLLVDSEVGKGTSFHLTVPIAEATGQSQ